MVNKHFAIKAGLLLIRVLCIRQEMLGKLHLIALELPDHHYGNEPTSVPWEDQNTVLLADEDWEDMVSPR